MRDLLERYWNAQDPYDLDALASLRHPQWTAVLAVLSGIGAAVTLRRRIAKH